MMKTCIDCKRCKDISLNPHVMKLWCEEAEGRIYKDSIVMVEGADECADFQERLQRTHF